MYNYDLKELKKEVIEQLEEVGITVEDIAGVVYELQSKYIKDLTMEECVENVNAVLDKREVIHSILTGLALDRLAENKQLPEPLQTIITKDEGLYGIDEILALGIVNIYGTIGLTNFGYLDKEKTGVIKKLDQRKNVDGRVTTFADDLVCAIAASAASRIAHNEHK